MYSRRSAVISAVRESYNNKPTNQPTKLIMKTLYNTILIFSLMLLGYGVLENQRHNGILLGIAAKHEALHTEQGQINTLQAELNAKLVDAYLFQNEVNEAVLNAILLSQNDK